MLTRTAVLVYCSYRVAVYPVPRGKTSRLTVLHEKGLYFTYIPHSIYEPHKADPSTARAILWECGHERPELARREGISTGR